MDNKRYTENDAYEELLNSFSSAKPKEISHDDVKNHGEVYFSSNANAYKKSNVNFQQQAPINNRPNSNAYNRPNTKNAVGKTAANTSKPANNNSKPAPKKSKKKRAKRKKYESAVIAVVIVVFAFVAALLVKIPIMGCINDILAINVSSSEYRIILEKDMDVNEVINILSDKKLINNTMFCKFFAAFRDLDKKEVSKGKTKKIVYPAGTYYLSPSMGLEGMLYEIRTSGIEDSTIKLTFPEGYSINQIAEKLEDNGVCTANAFYKAMESEELNAKYPFLSSITNKQLRYRYLEGYLYPDTYEFYLGEAATSVLDRFLGNFEEKWTENYSSKATEMGYTVDEIITVASILEKEAFDAEQMPIIASILYNRLESSSFPFINCDSTAQYIDNFKDELDKTNKYFDYMKVYDTYQKTGLPIGAICCPGADAIYSALYPESTNYYYFLHDKNGRIYLSETSAQHQENIRNYLGE